MSNQNDSNAMGIELYIDNLIALEAITEAIGWSLNAVGKRLDNGTDAQRRAATDKWLALDDLAAQLTAQRRDFVLDQRR